MILNSPLMFCLSSFLVLGILLGFQSSNSLILYHGEIEDGRYLSNLAKSTVIISCSTSFSKKHKIPYVSYFFSLPIRIGSIFQLTWTRKIIIFTNSIVRTIRISKRAGSVFLLLSLLIYKRWGEK